MAEIGVKVQEPRVWPRGQGVRSSSTGGSGGRCDFRSPRGGQGAMGLGDPVQVVQEFFTISGAWRAVRRS